MPFPDYTKITEIPTGFTNNNILGKTFSYTAKEDIIFVVNFKMTIAAAITININGSKVLSHIGDVWTNTPNQNIEQSIPSMYFMRKGDIIEITTRSSTTAEHIIYLYKIPLVAR